MTPEQQKAIAIAAARKRLQAQKATPEAEQPTDWTSRLRAGAQGAADMASFGLSDEIAAGVGSVAGMLPGGHGKGYSELLDEVRAQQEADAEANPKTHMAGQVLGAVGGGAGLARGGLSMTANAYRAGAGLPRLAATSAAEGGILGGIQGFGSGEGGVGERASNAAKGAGIGAGVGLASPLAIAGIGAVARPLVAPLMSRINPQSYTNQALTEGLQRSGQTPDDIANALRGAQADNQGMFVTADAMGNAGQRMLSTVTRTPNDARQGVIDTLMNRQAGQGQRISGALSQAFDAPDTAAQRTAALTDARRVAGNTNYGAARSAAGAVDAMPAVAAIDNVIQPGTIPPGTSETGVGGTLNRLRNMLINENGDIVNDFDRTLLVKQEMDAIIEQGGTVANLLRPARQALDDQLAAASQPYAAARDAYRQGSQNIEAVDIGRNAAMRGRTEDTLPAFQGMRPDQQSAFRAGYVDPLIERTQGAATGVNKARPLINDATAAEFPALAAPGQGPRLQRRIGREQTMFETNSQAMGGSRTADNIADAAEANKFDPGVIAALFQGAPVKAAMSAISTIGRNAQGQTPRVIEQIAQVLMETRPDVARQLFVDAANGGAVSAGRRAVINALMNTGGSGAGGRVLAP